MRTKNLFRTLAVASLAVISLNSFGQFLTNGAGATSNVDDGGNEVTEYVTVGSVMPYSVTPSTLDANLDVMLKPSVFRWVVTGAGNAITQQDGDALAAAPAPDAGSHTTDNAIAVSWGAGAGNYTLTAFEKYQVEDAYVALGITPCEDADGEVLNVTVVAKPSADWSEADLNLGGCSSGAGATVAINVDLTGFDNFRVTYSVAFEDFTGASSAIAGVTGSYTTANIGSSDFVADGTENDILAFNLATGTNYGKFTISMDAITDRISRKSLAVPTQDPGTPTSDDLIVYNLPTPTTGRVQHINNAATAW